MKKKIIIILHFILLFLSCTSWLWVSWNLNAFISLIHIAIQESSDGCFLSHTQFNDKLRNNTTFYEWWMSKLGIKIKNRAKLKIFMRYYIPIIVVLLGIIAQELFKLKVIISL